MIDTVKDKLFTDGLEVLHSMIKRLEITNKVDSNGEIGKFLKAFSKLINRFVLSFLIQGSGIARVYRRSR